MCCTLSKTSDLSSNNFLVITEGPTQDARTVTEFQSPYVLLTAFWVSLMVQNVFSRSLSGIKSQVFVNTCSHPLRLTLIRTSYQTTNIAFVQMLGLAFYPSFPPLGAIDWIPPIEDHVGAHRSYRLPHRFDSNTFGQYKSHFDTRRMPSNPIGSMGLVY